MALSQPMAHRQVSRQSTLSDDGPPQDTSDATGLLLERLQAWKHACVYLENYIEATEKLQKAHAKEYEKVLKTVADPLREGHHFDQSLGGMSGLMQNIRTNTQAISNLHTETEKNLKGSVLPILSRLHSEIKSKSKELQGGAGKGLKAVDKARAATQKHIDLLSHHSSAYENPVGKPDPNHDPYVLHRGIYHRLNKQIMEENASVQDVLTVQQSFSQFESHIIQTIQQAMGSFTQFVGGQATRQKALYEDMLGTTQVIPLDFEWKGFVSRNHGVLIDPNAPPRSIDHATFPHQNHKSTIPIVEGTLERKGKIMKSYTASYWVLTPAHFLHEFKDTDNYGKDPTPETSLYLPDCTIGELSGLKFLVKGKDVSNGKVGNAFSINSEFAFKAMSDHDAKKWYEAISAAAGTKTDSAPVSPVYTRQNSSTQQSPSAAEKPQLQTQGITGAETAKSPISAKPQSTVTSPSSAVPGSATQALPPQQVGTTPASAAGKTTKE